MKKKHDDYVTVGFRVPKSDLSYLTAVAESAHTEVDMVVAVLLATQLVRLKPRLWQTDEKPKKRA